jgi:hypothetical protein
MLAVGAHIEIILSIFLAYSAFLPCFPERAAVSTVSLLESASERPPPGVPSCLCILCGVSWSVGWCLFTAAHLCSCPLVVASGWGALGALFGVLIPLALSLVVGVSGGFAGLCDGVGLPGGAPRRAPPRRDLWPSGLAPRLVPWPVLCLVPWPVPCLVPWLVAQWDPSLGLWVMPLSTSRLGFLHAHFL